MLLNFKVFGEGEPLVILHGLYGASDNWVGIARELQSSFKVITVDLRNHGKSPHADEHNYELMSDDILNIFSKLEIYSANIIGHSMGGKVALAFAAFNPERVKRLVVVDISYRTYSEENNDLQFSEHVNIISALSDLPIDKLTKREDADVFLSERIKSVRVRSFLLKNLYRTSEKKFKWKLNLAVLKNNLRNVLQGFEEFEFELSLLDCPVLFIKGGNSMYLGKEDFEKIPTIFKRAEIKTIEGASHWVHAEKPKEFLQMVKEFFL